MVNERHSHRCREYRAGLVHECRVSSFLCRLRLFQASAKFANFRNLAEFESLSRLCGSGIINNRKFVERHAPWQLPDDGLITEFPDEFEGDGIGAFLAFRE